MKKLLCRVWASKLTWLLVVTSAISIAALSPTIMSDHEDEADSARPPFFSHASSASGNIPLEPDSVLNTESQNDTQGQEGNDIFMPENWPWEADPDVAAKRDAAIARLRESRGCVMFFSDEWEWCSRAFPGIHVEDVFGDREPRDIQLIRGVSFSYVNTIPSTVYEDRGVKIPGGVEEPYEVPDHVKDDLLLETLPHLSDTSNLCLENTSITDEGLSVILELPYLANLMLVHSWPRRYPVSLSDEGMEFLGDHPNLYWVRIEGIPITNKGIAEIARSKSISSLHLSSCAITADCFVSLAKMPQLTYLHLSYRPVLVIPEEDCIDFSQPIDEEVADAIASLDGRLTHLTLALDDIHPSILEAVARIESLEDYRGPPLPSTSQSLASTTP